MSRLIHTTEYDNDPSNLAGGIYTLDESLYLDTSTFKVTNNVANADMSIGIIGTVQEVPDLTATSNAPPRMVIRLSVSDTLIGAIKRTLNSSDL